MVGSKVKVSTKKERAQIIKDLNSSRAAAAERSWLRGNKTVMDQNIMAAGNNKPAIVPKTK